MDTLDDAVTADGRHQAKLDRAQCFSRSQEPDPGPLEPEFVDLLLRTEPCDAGWLR